MSLVLSYLGYLKVLRFRCLGQTYPTFPSYQFSPTASRAKDRTHESYFLLRKQTPLSNVSPITDDSTRRLKFKTPHVGFSVALYTADLSRLLRPIFASRLSVVLYFPRSDPYTDSRVYQKSFPPHVLWCSLRVFCEFSYPPFLRGFHLTLPV